MRHRGEGIALGMLTSSLLALLMLLSALVWALYGQPELLAPPALPQTESPPPAEAPEEATEPRVVETPPVEVVRERAVDETPPLVEPPVETPPDVQPPVEMAPDAEVAEEPPVEPMRRRHGTPTAARSALLTTVEGRLSFSRANRILTAHDPLARGCYESALRRRPGAEGDAVLRFDVPEGRRVPTVRVMGATFADEDFERCLVESFMFVRFPRFSRRSRLRVTATYRFRLE